MKKIILVFILFITAAVQAQLSVDNSTMTPRQLTENYLLIPNDPNIPQTVFPLNFIYNKTVANSLILNDQIGKWETGADSGNLGLGVNQRGVLLTTGQATVALGPNNTQSAYLNTLTPSMPTQNDPDLAILSKGYSVRNVSILEFDFVASGNVLNFDYVFASEEYPEYALSIFNDVFGFFLSGPGLNGGQGFTNDGVNLAVLPTTTSTSNIVSINNVNAVINSEYYVSNGDGSTPLVNYFTQYDGFTKPLQAIATLQIGQTYHIKFAIAHVSDNAYDSGVFLKNLSISNAALALKENVFDAKFSIYPNPSTDNVTISNTTNLTINEVKIIDMNGRIIKSEKFNDMTAVKINISEINSGVYFLEINSNEGKAVKRLIKN